MPAIRAISAWWRSIAASAISTRRKRGERLTAHAGERQREGRSGIYDVAVTREDGTVIAEFRGHARAIAGNIVADDK